MPIIPGDSPSQCLCFLCLALPSPAFWHFGRLTTFASFTRHSHTAIEVSTEQVHKLSQRDASIQPENAEALFARGRALERLGNYNMAFEDFSTLRKIALPQKYWPVSGIASIDWDNIKQPLTPISAPSAESSKLPAC